MADFRTGCRALRHHVNRAPMAGETRLGGKPSKLQPMTEERSLLSRLMGFGR